MYYCTNPADDGREIRIRGVEFIRTALSAPDVSETLRDAYLKEEREAVANYYNWLFDREQERKDTK